MKELIKLFTVDLFVSFILSLFLFFILKDFFDIKLEILILIATFVCVSIFIFSFMMSFFIYKLKSKIDFLNLEINRLNKYDEITNIYNRNFLLESLKKYFYLSERKKEYPLSIMLMDIDNFQNINKTYGFETGNKVLKKVADILKNNIRDMDIVGRYNADEFLIVSFINKDEMLLFANRCKKLINDLKIDKNIISINVSIGITQKKSLDKFMDFLIRAQEAVILAQKKGGNQIDLLEHFLLI